MAARNKETVVLLLDVGPTMHDHLDYTSQAVSALAQRKLVHNKYDEVGVVFFGTTETENHLTDAELEGYENIVVARALSVVNDDLAETVKELPRGFGSSDLISAIVLGIDMIVNKTGPASKNKRIFLITDGETLVKEPTEGTKKDQVITLADQMQQKGLSLDAVVIRTKASSKSLLSAASRENEVLLQTFASRTKGDVILADSYTSLLGSVRTRSVSPTTLYRGELELTPKMAVKVWVYKKVSPERIPTLKMYSDRARDPQGFATHEVKLDTEYKSTQDPDVSVPPEQRIKAYKYGPQFVPISSAEEDKFKFQPEKGLKLIGFTDATNIPRHYYMKEANVFVPEPGNVRSALAISCLARAMAENHTVAIVRCVWRAGQNNVVLGVLTPYLASEDDVADCFIFSILPFSEDLREFPFPSFEDRPASQQPTKIQQQAADAIVQMLDLAPDVSQEMLRPERTVNPLLQRFYNFLHLKYKDPEADVPPLEGALQKIVEPDQKFLQANESTLLGFRQQFTLSYNTQKEKGRKFWQEGLEEGDGNAGLLQQGSDLQQPEEGKPLSLEFLTDKKVDHVGSVNPVQDFQAMLDRRDSGEWIPKAIREMKKIISDLLSSAYSGNTYEKALSCLTALRVGCVMQEEPLEFNSFLEEIAQRCQGKRLHDFWELVLSKSLSLITRDEAPDSGVTQEEAASFLSGDASRGKVSEAPEEEIDEMDAILDEIE